MNYRLTLQYDGTDFHGWQVQSDGRTVQGELTRVLALLEGREVVVHGAGRTDAGVHAEGQVASVQSRARHRAGASARGAQRQSRARCARDGVERGRGRLPCALLSARENLRLQNLQRARHVSLLEPLCAARGAPARRGAHALGRAPLPRPTRLDGLLRGAVRGAARACALSPSWKSTEQLDGRGRARSKSERARTASCATWCAPSRARCSRPGAARLTKQTVARAINTGDRSLAGATAPPHGLTLMKVHY